MRTYITILALVALHGWTATAAETDLGITDAEITDPEITDLKVNGAQVSLIQNTFVASPIAGVVSQVNVVEGVRVQSGVCMVQLDDQHARTEVAAARAKLQAAQLESSNDIDQRFAERTLEVRRQELQASLQANQRYAGAISDTEIERLKLVVDQSQLAIEQAKHELAVARARAGEQQAALEIAQAMLDKHAIKTTVDGIVAEVAIEPGEWVEPGTPIVRVIALDPIRVECFVDGRSYGPELVGARVKFYPDLGTKAKDSLLPLTGEVAFVSPEVHAVTSQARLWATIRNPNHRIRAGLQGRLVIETRD
tara:strand:+ start:24749 stop:25675 length:927 start_codon:yes stop_codon:yes gene_type:complete